MSEVTDAIERLGAANRDVIMHFEVLYRDFSALTVRYDDAMKRIQDMQAELEFLRSELARRVE